MSEINLIWSDPYSFRTLLTDTDLREKWRVSGLYLHIDQTSPTKPESYVGKSQSDLWTRQVQHYTSIIAGHCVIPGHVRANGDGRWEMAYSKSRKEKEEVLRTILDEDKYVEVVRDGFRFAGRIEIVLCEFANNSNGIRIQDVERQLIYELKPDPPQKTWVPLVHFEITHHNAVWATSAMRQAYSELGMKFV